MDTNPQRVAAIKLAEAAGATRTVALLRSDDYGDISKVMQLAIAEVGLDAFVNAVRDGHPGWASDALRCAGDLGDHRESLIALAAADSPAPTAGDAAASGAMAVGNNVSVSSFTLYLAPGAAMVAKFTMFWGHDGQLYPSAPDTGQWLWSIDLSIATNRQWMMACTDFSQHLNAPLSPGDMVWMVQRSCSTNHDTGFRFIYEPDGPNVQINVVGTATDPVFSIN